MRGVAAAEDGGRRTSQAAPSLAAQAASALDRRRIALGIIVEAPIGRRRNSVVQILLRLQRWRWRSRLGLGLSNGTRLRPIARNRRLTLCGLWPMACGLITALCPVPGALCPEPPRIPRLDFKRLSTPQQNVIRRALQIGVEEAAQHVAQQGPQLVLHLEHELARRLGSDRVHVRLAAATADHEALER